MRCFAARRKILAYAGGDLAPRAAAHLERHLAACPACRAAALQDRNCLAALRVGGAEVQPPDPEETIAALFAQAGRGPRLENLSAEPRQPCARAAAFAAGFAAAALVLAALRLAWPAAGRPSGAPAPDWSAENWRCAPGMDEAQRAQARLLCREVERLRRSLADAGRRAPDLRPAVEPLLGRLEPGACLPAASDEEILILTPEALRQLREGRDHVRRVLANDTRLRELLEE